MPLRSGGAVWRCGREGACSTGLKVHEIEGRWYDGRIEGDGSERDVLLAFSINITLIIYVNSCTYNSLATKLSDGQASFQFSQKETFS